MKSTLLVTLMLGLGLAMPSFACQENHGQTEAKPVATQDAATHQGHAMKEEAAHHDHANMDKPKCKCKEGKPCKEMQEGKKCKCHEKKGCPVKAKEAQSGEAPKEGEAPKKKSCCPH